MKKSKFKILMYVNLVFIVLALIGNVYGYVSTNNYQFILNISALGLSLVYLFYGYKKFAASYFMFFMVFLAIKEGLALYSMIVDEKVPVYAAAIVGTMMLSYLCLAFIKNLGKKKSFIICGIILLLSLVTLISGLVYTPIVITAKTIVGLQLAMFNLTRVLMAIILIIMVYAKYEDKYSRGSK